MTYEYICAACGHEWEATQSINDDPLKKCPACNKNKAQRQVSGGTGFVLKGGGWYADGYSSSAPSASASSDGSSDSSSGSGDSSSSSDSGSSSSDSSDD